MTTSLAISTKTTDQLRAEIGALVQQYADLVYAPKPFEPGVSPVPVSGKVLGAKELQLMVEASLDGWLTTGRFNAMFEERLARYIGVKHLITVNSGSSANLVAFSTLTSPRLGERAIQKGDEVIGVAAGFPTTVNPILQFGAVPVFVDVDLATHNIDASLIEAAITPKTKAIMLAHSLGNPFNLDVVTALCKKYKLWLVEDCCDALGARYRGQLVGTFGDIGTLSFYPAHHITMGEGGAVFTNNAELKLIAESFRDWGRDCYCPPGKDNTCNKRFCWKLGNLPEGYDHKYTYSHLGYNLKISDMQAACALAQMDRLDHFVAARKRNFAFLHQRLKGVRGAEQAAVVQRREREEQRVHAEQDHPRQPVAPPLHGPERDLALVAEVERVQPSRLHQGKPFLGPQACGLGRGAHGFRGDGRSRASMSMALFYHSAALSRQGRNVHAGRRRP